MIKPPKVELAWATGLYEGEGSITRGIHLIAFRIGMCDREPLERIHQVFGGQLHGPFKPRKKNHSAYWYWTVCNWPDVLRLYHWMKPWLSQRRIAQIEKALINPSLRPRGANHPPGCPPKPIASQYGYHRHRRLGEPACPTCLASFALYMRNFNAKRKRAHR